MIAKTKFIKCHRCSKKHGIINMNNKRICTDCLDLAERCIILDLVSFGLSSQLEHVRFLAAVLSNHHGDEN